MKKLLFATCLLSLFIVEFTVSAQVNSRWDVSTPGTGNGCFRNSIRLNNGNIVASGDFQSSTGEAPSIMMFNPSLNGLISWCIQFGILYQVNYLFRDVLGTGFWNVSTWNASLMHINALGNFLQGIQVISSNSGYNVSIDKATTDPGSGNLIVAGRIINASNNNTKLYIANIDPTNNQITSYKVFDLWGNTGFYDIIQIIVANNMIMMGLYDGNVNNRTYILTSLTLATLSGYSTPFGYLDPRMFYFDPVSGNIVFAGSGISSSCTGNECAMLAFMNPLSPLAITAYFFNWSSNYAKYLMALQTYSPGNIQPAANFFTAWGNEFDFNTYSNKAPIALNFDLNNMSASLTELPASSGQWNGIEEGWFALGCFDNGLGGSKGVIEKLPQPESVDDCGNVIHPTVTTSIFHPTAVTINIDNSFSLSTTNFTINPVPVTATLTPSCTKTCDLVAFYFNDDTVCAGSPVVFSDSSFGNPGPAFWSWTFGDGDSSNIQSPTHTYINPGTYDVKLVVYDDWGCVDSFITQITVCSNPVAGAFMPDPVCWNGSPITFTMKDASSKGSCGTYLETSTWLLSGDVTSYTGYSHDYTFNGPGSWTVLHTVVDKNGCIDSISIPIIIHSGPTASFSWIPDNDSICENDTVEFTDMSIPGDAPIVSWKWDFDDGSNINTMQSPNHLFSLFLAQDFNVKLVITDANGCSDSITHAIHVVVLPSITLQGVTDTCFDAANGFNQFKFSFVVLPGDNPITAINWNFGDGGGKIPGGNPLTHKYLGPGTYVVSACVTEDFGCEVCDSMIVKVFANPIVGWDADDPLCAGAGMHFVDLSVPGDAPITTYFWNFGDGGSSNLKNPTHSYGAGGWYYVTHIVIDANGCRDENTDSVLVYEIAPAIGASNTNVCPYEDITFTDNSQPPQLIGTVNWSFGDGQNALGHQVTHAYTNPGVYQVMAIITDTLSSCEDTVYLNITVTQGPTARFYNDTVCIGDTSFFTDTSIGNIVTWFWDFNDGDTSWLNSPAHLFSRADTFWVFHQVWDAQGCWDTITQQVFVDSLPPLAAFTFTGSNHTVSFQDQSQYAHSWFWDFGDGSVDSIENPVHTFTDNSLVILSVSNGCGTDTTSTFLVFTGMNVSPQQTTLQIIPNPSSGRFNIVIKNINSTHIRLELSNIDGKSVLSKYYTGTGNALSYYIDERNLPKGIYLLRVRMNESVFIRKIIIQ